MNMSADHQTNYKRSELINSHQQQQLVVSSRWNPTPEQLQTLEELYRRGTRTPTSDQIQYITAQLRRYGKIEGKNVFYWFQNHKARERQKRRRHLDQKTAVTATHHQNELVEIETSSSAAAADADAGDDAKRTPIEVEETKKWASPRNFSTILAETNISMISRQVITDATCKRYGWIEFKGKKGLMKRNGRQWQTMLNLSTSSSTSLVNSSLSTPSSATGSAKTTRCLANNFEGHDEDDAGNYERSKGSDTNYSGGCDAQTLQLFPLQSGGDQAAAEGLSVGVNNNITTNVAPFPFFEFLPLKN